MCAPDTSGGMEANMHATSSNIFTQCFPKRPECWFQKSQEIARVF